MRVGHVIVPADDMDAQVAFYQALGLSLRFRDGDRYAGVTDGTVTLGLADASQQPVAGRTLLSFEVDDLDLAVAGALAAGATGGQQGVGAHERQALVVDPCGNAVVLYERLS
jgi:predicted enzyme related to lactoylglutathione lyase